MYFCGKRDVQDFLKDWVDKRGGGGAKIRTKCSGFGFFFVHDLSEAIPHFAANLHKILVKVREEMKLGSASLEINDRAGHSQLQQLTATIIISWLALVLQTTTNNINNNMLILSDDHSCLRR